MKHIRFDQLPRLGALLRSHFLSGLLVVTPFGVIVWISIVALQALWGLRQLVPEPWRPEHWLPSTTLAWLVDVAITLGAVAFLALSISLIGWVSKQLLGQKLLDFVADHVIQRIPVLRSVYSALEQLLRTFTQGGGQQFHRVVYVEYPRKGVWAIAFVTGPVRESALLEGLVNIYVPTTPNPTSGFHLIVPEAEVKPTNLSVEEAFRTILSLGIVHSGIAPARRMTPPAQQKAG
ncbi:MAG: DUF502 domain-containing protein [Deltaproteobacteria bacterium]|nr:DUF502 domain-containing protein [Deltaproteobacteria bacterium]